MNSSRAMAVFSASTTRFSRSSTRRKRVTSSSPWNIRPLGAVTDTPVGQTLEQKFFQRFVVFKKLFHAAVVDAIQRGLRDIQMAAIDEFLVIAEKESEHEGADMGSVHIGVGHDHNFMYSAGRSS